jgi:hypothetical protein
MPNHTTQSDILNLINKAKTRNRRIALYKEYDSLALRNTLRGSFDASVTWAIPEGAPPFSPDKSEVYFDLNKVTAKLGYLVSSNTNGLTLARKEIIFQEILESIHPDDAEIVIAMKDKTLHEKFENLKVDEIDKCFPGLIRQPTQVK